MLAVKDEYEVARLYTDGRFEQRLRQTFEDGWRLTFHLAPPLFAKRDPVTGHLIKREYGPWVMTAFRLLASLKRLRGTAFDILGRTNERKAERQLIKEFEETIETIVAGLTPDNHAAAVELAALPLQIRGFGHVKEAAITAAQSCQHSLIAAFRSDDDNREHKREAAE